MNKLTKKILSLLLAVMMIMSLAACGAEEPAEAPAQESAAAESAVPEAEAAEEEKAEEAPADAEALKNLAITVVHGDGSSRVIELATKAENLREALEPEGIIAGDESEYGLFVKTVDGETADDTKQQWWAVTKGGEMTETGVDGIMIADGESYEFTLTTGW